MEEEDGSVGELVALSPCVADAGALSLLMGISTAVPYA